MTDTNKIPDEPGTPDAETQLEDEDSINFSDRLIAFLLLVGWLSKRVHAYRKTT